MDGIELNFFRGKRVFVTGHTGFKGAWLCRILADAGAEVTGYALPAPTQPNLFEIAGLKDRIVSVMGDIRDRERLTKSFHPARPEIVFHLAAQPIVRDGYRDPAGTYETNVMGTVNLLECVRHSQRVRSVLNVTTDKVYHNNEWPWGYREEDPLDGFDPYSNSKSCSELVTHCYHRSFFAGTDVSISTARAGNVIGGGDFAPDRILPDCVRAASEGRSILLRNPQSTRPYQHVLEPLFAYLMIARRQYEDKKYEGWYNVGPDECDCVTTGELAELFCRTWGGVTWESCAEAYAPHEAGMLKLDCAKLKTVFGWRPRWNIQQSVEKTVEWFKAWLGGGDTSGIMGRQIRDYWEAGGAYAMSFR